MDKELIIWVNQEVRCYETKIEKKTFKPSRLIG